MVPRNSNFTTLQHASQPFNISKEQQQSQSYTTISIVNVGINIYIIGNEEEEAR